MTVDVTPVASSGYGSITAADLMAMEFAPGRPVVPGLIGEGLTLLAGPPKIGKSLLMLSVAVAVATGGEALGSLPCEAANVLYVILEDGKRRVQDRLRNLLGSDPVPDNLSFQFECQRLDAGGLDDLRVACQDGDVKVLIVDVLEPIRPAKKHNEVFTHGIIALFMGCNISPPKSGLRLWSCTTRARRLPMTRSTACPERRA